jgi:hypothetical protein
MATGTPADSSLLQYGAPGAVATTIAVSGPGAAQVNIANSERSPRTGLAHPFDFPLTPKE